MNLTLYTSVMIAATARRNCVRDLPILRYDTRAVRYVHVIIRER